VEGTFGVSIDRRTSVNAATNLGRTRGEKLVAVGAANDETRSLLLGMLEDLAHRIREETIGAAEAAAVLREIAPFCRPRVEGEGSDLAELRTLLRSGALRAYAPGFVDFHSRVAHGKVR
jgi:hypothetical protein